MFGVMLSSQSNEEGKGVVLEGKIKIDIYSGEILG